jgi:hypothetical protein
MRKVASILIVSLLLFNSMGYYIAFKASQYTLRKEIKKKIKNSFSDNDLIQIAVSDNDQEKKAEMEWTDEHEFRYHGHMFDVIRYRTSNDTTYYSCINDVKEEALFANLDNMVKQQSEKGTPYSSKVIKLINSIIRVAIPENVHLTEYNGNEVTILEAIEFSQSSYSGDVPAPPPKA